MEGGRFRTYGSPETSAAFLRWPFLPAQPRGRIVSSHVSILVVIGLIQVL